MSEGKYIKNIPIKNYDELVEIIQGKTDLCDDLREKFIFRGLEDDAYELIPSALRNDNKLDNFVDEDFKTTFSLSHEKAVEYGFISADEKYDDKEFFPVNKYGKLIEEKVNDYTMTLEEFQFKKEMNALMKFLNYSDKLGLKIPIKQDVRELIEHDIRRKFNHESFWPDEDFYELISLGQHYGIPTRALDWSYDYKVSLYFTVKNILDNNYTSKEKPKNGILWAFNYKNFDRHLFTQGKHYHTCYYRPEYNSNPNLNAQKGLFTFVIKDFYENSFEPFDKYIEKILEIFNYQRKILHEDELAFYKFIIPEEIKPDILNELYLEGYSEGYLFPGYKGVSETIENRIKLDKLLNHRYSCPNK